MDVISSAPFTDIGQSIQSTMAQAGIKLNLVPGSSAQVITKYRARNHEAMLLYWGPDFMDPHSNAKAFAYNIDNADTAPQSTTTWRNSWAAERAVGQDARGAGRTGCGQAARYVSRFATGGDEGSAVGHYLSGAGAGGAPRRGERLRPWRGE